MTRCRNVLCCSLVLACLCAADALAPTAEAAFRGRNGAIAFVKRDRNSDSTIWAVRPGAKRARPLTLKPRRCRRGEGWTDEHPDYSPSGKRIVYRHADGCGRGYHDELRLMRPDGSRSRRLLRLPSESSGPPAFTADGKEVTFDAPDPQGFGTPAIHFVDSRSGRSTRSPIPTSLAFGVEPTWASSGMLALSGGLGQASGGVTGSSANEEIIVGDASGRAFRRLTHPARPKDATFWGDESPDWAPRRNRIAFTRWAELCLPESSIARPRARAADPPCESETADLSDIYVIDAAGTRRARRLTRLRDAASPAFSPDGRKIAFHGRKRFIYVMSAGGARLRKIARGEQPDWQPLAPRPLRR